ncbi:hypothetical protein FB45DRAFT_1031854 [Roridomyces roridus]|uniref:60S acidic ribosomal protein P1 n=1 Tax=Roridomyces roridus TaxID=1738132 RepID=A0AAD7FJ91_9AGAR|nr:hypothetical protein FB45DRAFT_1031854 [Roridomyces roridus]
MTEELEAYVENWFAVACCCVRLGGDDFEVKEYLANPDVFAVVEAAPAAAAADPAESKAEEKEEEAEESDEDMGFGLFD